MGLGFSFGLGFMVRLRVWGLGPETCFFGLARRHRLRCLRGGGVPWFRGCSRCNIGALIIRIGSL